MKIEMVIPSKLIIDQEFRDLIRPLTEEECLLLEENIAEKGCIDPIIVWDDVIVDGYNRYEICTRLKIPYQIRYMDFRSREQACIWICNNQLGRRNLSEEARRYLIGKKFELQKLSNPQHNVHGKNQYSKENGATEECGTQVKEDTAGKIGAEYGINRATVMKYSHYSSAVDRIAKVDPLVRSRILAGRCKVSQENIVKIAKMSDKDIKAVSRKLVQQKTSFVSYSASRRHIGERRDPDECLTTGIKQMPRHDPDTEIIGLALTVPSWIQSVNRIRESSDLPGISHSAMEKLGEALLELQIAIEELMEDLERK